MLLFAICCCFAGWCDFCSCCVRAWFWVLVLVYGCGTSFLGGFGCCFGLVVLIYLRVGVVDVFEVAWTGVLVTSGFGLIWFVTWVDFVFRFAGWFSLLCWCGQVLDLVLFRLINGFAWWLVWLGVLVLVQVVWCCAVCVDLVCGLAGWLLLWCKFGVLFGWIWLWTL